MKEATILIKGDVLEGIIGKSANTIIKSNAKYILTKKDHPFSENKNIKNVIFDCPILEKIKERGLMCCTFQKIDFSNCKNLVSFDSFSFSESKLLREVTCPCSLRTICSSAFSLCTSLRRIHFPINSKLVSIAKQAFMNTSLSEFYIPSKLELIYFDAFDYVLTMKNVTIHKENHCFVYENGCIVNQHNSRMMICFKRYEETCLEIPFCKYIKSCSLHGSKITKVIFPKGLVMTGGYAFAYSNLKEIDFTRCKDSLINVSQECFACCDRLEIVDLSMCNKLKHIHSFAFANCLSLKLVKLPKCEFETRKNCFANDISLREVIIEKGSEYIRIEDATFYNTSISSFYIGPRCFHIGTKVFAYTKVINIDIDENNIYFELNNHLLIMKNSNIAVLYLSIFENTKCVIPRGIEVIRNSCFYGALKLKEITLPLTLKIIMQEAISQTGITSIIVPESVNNFGMYCFANNDNLEIIHIKSKMIKIPIGFSINCTNLKIVNFEHSVISIREDSFYGCTKIQCVYAPQACIKKFKNILPLRVMSNSVCNIRELEIKVI